MMISMYRSNDAMMRVSATKKQAEAHKSRMTAFLIAARLTSEVSLKANELDTTERRKLCGIH